MGKRDDDGIEMLRGMFEGGNFPNAQINVLTGDGVQVSYESSKRREKDDSVTTSKDAVLEYVRRLMPVVKEEYRDNYETIWTGILELEAVRVKIYDKGKQKDTTFNRNLLAQMIHQVSSVLYVPTANTVQMSEYLEPQKGVDHPVRQKLGESPERTIKNAIDDYLKDII